MSAPTSWFDAVYGHAKARGLSPELLHHIADNRDRIVATVELLRPFNLRGKRVVELGPGGVGLAVKHELGAEVIGYDVSDWSKEMCDKVGIEWRHVDLHKPGFDIGSGYDAVLMCEVIEHLARWPVEILTELRAALAPGGVLMVTTQNLHRLSQRLRMLTGRRLFAHYVPEDLVMAHLREYTPEELEYLFKRAGFADPKTKFVNCPDLGSPAIVQAGYNAATRLVPRLANIIACWATR
jgi:2-polyprenyl-3-methyl-5-hydroxy-6-metoxy-1,4-benzoquinol methylase